MPRRLLSVTELPPRGLAKIRSRVAVHLLAWVGVALLPLLVNLLTQRTPPPGLHYGFVLLPVALLAAFYYLNSLVLIPRLLARRRTGPYFAAVALAGSVLAWAMAGLMVLARLALVPEPPGGHYLAPLVAMLVNFGVVWALSSWGRITSEWFEAERRGRELENGHLAAELALLKSQVSPHFLFNTLNNVYSLAHLKSDDAPVVILKLSQLLRYMLYEADTPRVPLTREIEYLDNYVDLQRLRLDEALAVDFQVEGDCTGLLLEPLLLLPFVENAFKHGVSYQHPVPIVMALRVANGRLHFRVQNGGLVPAGPAPRPANGLGLPNIERRLALLYPGRHTLRAGVEGDAFVVELELELEPAGAAAHAIAAPLSTAHSFPFA